MPAHPRIIAGFWGEAGFRLRLFRLWHVLCILVEATRRSRAGSSGEEEGVFR
jgi:hypothetical protein